MRRAWFAASLILFGTSALAGECADETQSGMNQCAGEAFKKADAELNRTYKKVVERGKDPSSKALLVDAQRKWVAFRDAECGFQASGVTGGSVHPMIYSNCLEGVTARRTEELQYYLKCQEGDLSCPTWTN